MLNDCDALIIYTSHSVCFEEKKIKRGKNRHPIIKAVKKITIPSLKFIPYVFSRVFSTQIFNRFEFIMKSKL